MDEKNVVSLTVTMTKEDRKAFKQLALDQDTTVSALLRKWLHEHLEQGVEADGTEDGEG